MPDPTGIAALDQVLVWGGAVSIALGIGTGLWRVGRVLVRIGKGVDQYLTDWYGEPPRPGVAARPGVLERLQRTERQVDTLNGRVEQLAHEMQPNSGASLRDAIDRANCQLAQLLPEGSPCVRHPEHDPPSPAGPAGES
ncbi:hypothetical protein [Streptomyces sp. NBC_00425]|uniref:hypothetical protein n=1 Tax=Streptomyces sp. NBC_00425 TaxID=2975740 RepID=UPI002E211E02